MYLKEINTSGFKSFADKITFSLDGKITCIVGPNGSGKSNVVDAVRWVLGEQSVKSLRGTDSMTDVIFSGSKTRNALNVASVSLTFDNSDHFINIPYTEITIKRRVYRTGENEYFLNGEKCRLKDINDLLLDTATSKESFNIISQGEISKILSNSANDRRYIFESASGVLKYKKRKEEALRKLEKTQNNIERVQDIILEIESRIEPLKEQSTKAKEYLDTKEKLENIEVAVLAYDIDKLNYDYEKTNKEIEELNNEIVNLSLKSTKGDTDLVELKNELLKIEKDIKDTNAALIELTSKEEKLSGEKELLKERSSYDASDSKVHDNIANLKEGIMQNENAIKLVLKDIELLNTSLGDAKADITKSELEYNSLKKKRSETNIEYDGKRREAFDVEHKIDQITNYIENNGDVPSSVKSILNNPRIKGVHGVFSSILDTKDEYVKALEVSILSTKNYIIVDTEEVAKVAIEYLKENNLGRATFFPLNVIKPKGIDAESIDKIKSMSGFVGIFSDLVTYDSEYYNIVSNQLGNVILASDIDSANRISSAITRRYKVVSLDGSVINVGGSISGGSLYRSTSVITQKRELENLERRKVELAEVNDNLNTTLNKINVDITFLEEKLYNQKINQQKIEEQIKNKEEIIVETNKSLEESNRELESLSHVTDSTVSEMEEKIMKEYYEVSLEKNTTLKNLKSLEKDKDKINKEIEEIEYQNRSSSSDLRAKEKTLKDLELKNNKISFKLDNYLKVLSEEYSLTFERAKANYTLDKDINEARSEISSYHSILKSIGMVNVDSIKEYETVSERYEFLSNQKNDLFNAKNTLLEIIDEMDEVMKRDFMDTFVKVREEFQKVFKELFGGGSADLKLTDKDNILETGIDIVASPPGKKLKSVTLLSGGEMTLTAISLIFAILNVRNVPFCIFDEVEAALDEANVDNFGKYLDHYKDKTQFLIITHKKKTMEYADTLYGITMQESGVSKLVSVKLAGIDK